MVLGYVIQRLQVWSNVGWRKWETCVDNSPYPSYPSQSTSLNSASMSRELQKKQSGDGNDTRSSTASTSSKSVDPYRLYNLDGNSYLEQNGVPAYMKDALAIILENRPDDPIAFLAQYFRSVCGPEPTAVEKAYRLARLTDYNRETFLDNIVAAYGILESSSGGMLLREDVASLVTMVARDFPPPILDGILDGLPAHNDDEVHFQSFMAALALCLSFEECLVHANALATASSRDGTQMLDYHLYLLFVREAIIAAEGSTVPTDEIMLMKSVESILRSPSGDENSLSVRQFVQRMVSTGVWKQQASL
jgi:hypothetical protein